MVYISLLGIILTIVLFIILSFRGIPVTVSSVILIFVLWLFSLGCTDAQNFSELTDTFGSGMANIVKSYLLLFMVSALFGSLINATGIASSLGRSYEALVLKAPERTRKLLAVTLVPALNALFIYSGISVYVVVFAVVAVAKDLFRRMDIPWYMYSMSTIGSATFAAVSLPGSPSVVNLAPMPYTGTDMSPAPVFSAVITAECVIFGILYMQYALKRSERLKEGFLPTGKDISAMDIDSAEEQRPVPMVLAIPVVILPILLINLLKLQVIIALLITNICLMAVFRKRLTLYRLKAALISGLTAGINPTMTMALMSGFTAVLINTPGFQPVLDMLFSLPMPEYLKIVLMLGVVGFITGNFNAAVPPCMDTLGPGALAAAGVNMEVMHRLITISSLFCISPHNSGLCNSVAVARLTHKSTYRHYFMIGPVLGVILTLSAIVLIKLGIVF